MVRFGYAVGVLMLAGGLGLGLWGAPYHMLDWGGALMMSGAILGSAGAVALLLAAILAQLRRMAFAAPAAAAEPAPPMRVEPTVEEPDAAGPIALRPRRRPSRPPLRPRPRPPRQPRRSRAGRSPPAASPRPRPAS